MPTGNAPGNLPSTPPRSSRGWQVMGHIAVGFTLACGGFVLAAALAARAGAAEGQGLAGGAIIVAYGVLGALGGLLASWPLTRVLSGNARRWLFMLCLPLAVLLLFVLVGGWWHSRSEMNRHLEQAYENMPKFHLELQPGPVVQGVPSQRFVADWRSRRFEVTAGDRVCAGEISGKDAVLLLGALREAELITFRDPDACSRNPGELVQHLVFHIPEALPPATRGDIKITEACAARYPDLRAPARAAERLLASRDHLRDCL